MEYMFDYIMRDADGIFSHREFSLEELESSYGITRIEVVARRLFSGKYDREKNPIYDGDFVKNDYTEGLKGLGVIIFEDSSFKVKWIDPTYIRVRGEKPEPLFANSEIVWKVIGNIYENVNLLP